MGETVSSGEVISVPSEDIEVLPWISNVIKQSLTSGKR